MGLFDFNKELELLRKRRDTFQKMSPLETVVADSFDNDAAKELSRLGQKSAAHDKLLVDIGNLLDRWRSSGDYDDVCSDELAEILEM